MTTIACVVRSTRDSLESLFLRRRFIRNCHNIHGASGWKVILCESVVGGDSSERGIRSSFGYWRQILMNFVNFFLKGKSN